MIRKQLKFENGKTYAISSSRGSYTIIAGDISETTGSSDNSSPSKSLRTGVGSPSANLGASGDIFIDVVENKMFHRDSLGWDSGHSMQGSSGSSGTNGKSMKFGAGAPSSSLGLDDEIYIDVSDFKIHMKSSGTWSAGTQFKGEAGEQGFGTCKYIDALKGDTLLSYGADKQLYFDDIETNNGGLITKGGNLSAGSTFAIEQGKSGRYKVEFNAAFKLVPSSNISKTTASLEAALFINNIEQERVTCSTPVGGLIPNSDTVYKSVSLSKNLYLNESATIKLKVNLTNSLSNINVYANAIDKSTDGEDTFIAVTKL